MLWPLVALVAVLAAWHRLGEWLHARREAREFHDRLVTYSAEAKKAREESERTLADLASRMGRVELAVRER